MALVKVTFEALVKVKFECVNCMNVIQYCYMTFKIEYYIHNTTSIQSYGLSITNV